MEVLKKVIIAVVSAAASYYAAKKTKEFLERKSLRVRMNGARGAMADIQSRARDKTKTTLNGVKRKAEEAKQKLNDLINREADE